MVGLIFLQLAGGFLSALRGTRVHSIREWIAVVTFRAYVVYDFNRAQRIPRTTTNAVQAGAAVFLDVINIFVSLVEAMGSKKDEN